MGRPKDHSSTTVSRARALRKSAPDAELRLWQLLRNRHLRQFKFRRQHPIGKYFADFACVERKLVIELDGGQHADQAEYDAIRTQALQDAGFRVIRFWDNEVLTETEAILQRIYEELGHPSP